MRMMLSAMKRVGRWMIVAVVVVAAGGIMVARGYESAYPATKPGTVERKDIPALTVMEAQADGDYFAGGGNPVFMRLFRFIQSNKVAMTTPVEVAPPVNRMRFLVGTDDAGKDLRDQGEVRVKDLPARQVVSAGLRGSYSRERFAKGVRMVREWLEKNPGWKAAGEPYAVYWNSPFMPGFLKTSEIHLPIEPAGAAKP